MAATHPEPGKLDVLLVGNYLPDGQESMLRFGRVMLDELRARGVAAELVSPGAWFVRLRQGRGGLAKWLGYLDKYLVFPAVLRRRMRELRAGGVAHILDHSNAMYVPAAGSRGQRVVVTCHDLGAVRGALGEDTDCPATRMGKILQGWIARSLGRADAIACVSTATKNDVERLIRRPDGGSPHTLLALNGLNAPYAFLEAGEAQDRLQATGRPEFTAPAPFVLNVGSALPRKNRAGVLRIFALAAARWQEGRLVFAGEKLTPEEWQLAGELGLTQRVIEFSKPSGAVLEALYNEAVCLLFPSKFEGFGWPAAEAQACGCPVLCSDAGALPEVVAESAFVRPYADEEAFSTEILRLAHDESARERWRNLGLGNAERFSTGAMIETYRRVYAELGGAPASQDAAPVGVAR